MQIILNADDFGQDEETCRATIECFQSGSLSSATIMPNMPATPQAIEFARAHPQYSFGVHLTFLSHGPERPVCDPSEIPDLCAEDGRFLPFRTVRARAVRHALPIEQIEREAAAQIASL